MTQPLILVNGDHDMREMVVPDPRVLVWTRVATVRPAQTLPTGRLVHGTYENGKRVYP